MRSLYGDIEQLLDWYDEEDYLVGKLNANLETLNRQKFEDYADELRELVSLRENIYRLEKQVKAQFGDIVDGMKKLGIYSEEG